MSHVGTFEITSGRLHVTDPCYEDYDTELAATLPAVNGEWNAHIMLVKSMGTRVAKLHARADSYSSGAPYSSYELLNQHIGVDSGQAGIYDYKKFVENVGGEYDEPDTFYGKVCKTTLDENFAGTIDGFGVTSRSGYGDGGYECYVKRNSNGEVYEVMIDFINEDNDD